MAVNKKLQVWLPFIFSMVLIGGMYFGFKLRENIPAGKNIFGRDKNNSVQEILDLMRLRYVDALRTDSIQYGAIENMMGQLDPHSVYIPASDLQNVNEELAGNFEGIGVEFRILQDTVHVVFVISNGPSDKAGLRIGDRIIRVDSRSITGPQVTSDEVKNRIKGEQGSVVSLTILRKGETKKVDVKRGKIPIDAVDAAYMLDKQTGYIRLNRFSETAYREFMQSLEKLKKEGMTRLVFDLRGNGGGYMNEAVEIADEFLSDNKLVVYTEGLHVAKREYKCKRPGLFETGELVVLVDELSASASEVVAGALQDWCRAKILGRRTFGKGLVQEQYSLSDGSAVRLTVARYYTPKGRSIQRSYAKGKEEYLEEIRDRYVNGEALHPDTLKFRQGKIFRTDCGDTVYSGGGINPDIFISLDTGTKFQKIGILYTDNTLNNFLYNYYIAHQAEISSFSSPTEFSEKFRNTADMWNELLNLAHKDSLDLGDITPEEKSYLQHYIKAQLARFQWRTLGYYEIINQQDPVVEKALEEVYDEKKQ